MRIAIVDDIKEERDKLADVLTKQLSRRGIHVNLFEFENGEDFLIAAKERPFTVVFLDIYMSGASVLSAIWLHPDIASFSPSVWHPHLLHPTTDPAPNSPLNAPYCTTGSRHFLTNHRR